MTIKRPCHRCGHVHGLTFSTDRDAESFQVIAIAYPRDHWPRCEALKKPSWKKQTTRFLMFTHMRAFFNELERLYGCPNPCRMIGAGSTGAPASAGRCLWRR